MSYVSRGLEDSGGFPGSSAGKESTCNAGDLGSIPGLGRSSGGGHGNPLQYSYLENPMDRGAWQATAHGLTNELNTIQRLNRTQEILDPVSRPAYSHRLDLLFPDPSACCRPLVGSGATGRSSCHQQTFTQSTQRSHILVSGLSNGPGSVPPSGSIFHTRPEEHQ